MNVPYLFAVSFLVALTAASGSSSSTREAAASPDAGDVERLESSKLDRREYVERLGQLAKAYNDLIQRTNSIRS